MLSNLIFLHAKETNWWLVFGGEQTTASFFRSRYAGHHRHRLGMLRIAWGTNVPALLDMTCMGGHPKRDFRVKLPHTKVDGACLR